MSTALQAQAFVRVILKKVTGSDQLWQASVRPLVDPSTYWDGFKRPEVLSFDDVERALSDNRGAFEVATFGLTVDDRKGFWRALLADENTQYLTSCEISYLLISEHGRIALVEPRYEFLGTIATPSLGVGKQFKLTATSRLGSRYGPVDLQGKVLKREYNNVTAGGDFADNQFPRDSAGKKVAFLWGEKTDAGETNAQGEVISTGMMGIVNCGKIFQGATAGIPPTTASYLANPPAPTYTRYGGGGGTTWSYAVVVHSAAGHTSLGTPVTITGLPDAGAFTPGAVGSYVLPTNGVALFLAQYPADQQAQVIGLDLWVKKGTPDSVNAWHLMDAAPQMFNTGTNDPWAGPIGYYDNGDDSHFKGSPPPPNTNTAQITAGTPGTAPHSIFYNFYSWLGHKGKLTQIYASNLAEGEAAYKLISTDEIGTDYTSGKHFLLGPDGEGVEVVINGHTYFGFYAIGPKAEANDSGNFPFRVNGCGWHEANDTSLPIIDQAALVYQDIFTQLTGNNGEGYQTGARLTIPSFASSPTIPILQSTTFEAAQDITKLYMSNDKGYVACVYIFEAEETWGSLTTDMDAEFQFDLGENHHGQLILKIQNDMALPTDGLLLRERIELNGVSEPGNVADDEVENDTDQVYNWHPLDQKFLSGTKNIKNDLSIRMYGRRKGPDFQQRFVSDPATAVDTLKRYHLHRIVAPIYTTLEAKMRRATMVELGDQVRVQHRDMLTTEVPLYVRRRRFSYTNREITLAGRDMRGHYASGWAPDVTTGTDSSDATPTELATYWFWTNDDGTLPDGSAGSRWR